MRQSLIRLVAVAALAGGGAGCTTVPDAPIVANGPAAAEGSLVALMQPVQAGPVVLTPTRVLEDSRCPQNARCVWAGRAIVTTRIDGPGWRETRDFVLGVPLEEHGHMLTLVSVQPETTMDVITPSEDYRFAYQAR
jgi:hypothetical protein